MRPLRLAMQNRRSAPSGAVNLQRLPSNRSLLLTQSLLLAAVLVGLPAGAAEDVNKMALGKKLFNTTAVPACALCHTLKAAGSEGAVGPVFDDLKPNAERVKKALYDGLGNMPSFKASLSEAEIEALAYFVSRASGAQE